MCVTHAAEVTRELLAFLERNPAMTITTTPIVLEPAAQQVADDTGKPPSLSEPGAQAARKVLLDLQSGPVAKPDIDEEWVTSLTRSATSGSG